MDAADLFQLFIKPIVQFITGIWAEIVETPFIQLAPISYIVMADLIDEHKLGARKLFSAVVIDVV